MAERASRAARTRALWSLPLILAAVVAGMMPAAPASAQTDQATVRLLPPISSVEAKTGPFTVYIIVDGLEHHGSIVYPDSAGGEREEPSVGLAAFEFTILFDETVVALHRVEPGPTLDRSERTFQCLPPQEDIGEFRFGCVSLGSAPGLQGALTLAKVELHPVGDGSSPLNLEAGLSGPLGDPVPVSVVGGVVRVTGSVAASPTADDTVSTVPFATPTGGATSPNVSGATTPAVLGTPGSTARPDGLVLQDPSDPQGAGNIEAENNDSAGSGTLWTALAGAGVVAIGALGLTAILLRRRRHVEGA